MDKYNWPTSPSSTAFPIAKPGYPIIAGAAFVTAVLALLELVIPALVALVATIFICFFFRDPDRAVPSADGLVVSPADGKVIGIWPFEESEFYQGPGIRISVFMSVFNVHVNRSPDAGKITDLLYRPGRFYPADRDKAALENEHNAIFLETEEGRKICFVQIAGLVARRIICQIQPGDKVRRGQRIGMICFGSRLDIYLPPDFEVRVNKGDRVQAGASVLGVMP